MSPRLVFSTIFARLTPGAVDAKLGGQLGVERDVILRPKQNGDDYSHPYEMSKILAHISLPRKRVGVAEKGGGRAHENPRAARNSLCTFRFSHGFAGFSRSNLGLNRYSSKRL